MKRTIKLRESDLRRMIAESVKGVINELDWKTYQRSVPIGTLFLYSNGIQIRQCMIANARKTHRGSNR